MTDTKEDNERSNIFYLKISETASYKDIFPLEVLLRKMILQISSRCNKFKEVNCLYIKELNVCAIVIL